MNFSATAGGKCRKENFGMGFPKQKTNKINAVHILLFQSQRILINKRTPPSTVSVLFSKD